MSAKKSSAQAMRESRKRNAEKYERIICHIPRGDPTNRRRILDLLRRIGGKTGA